MKAIVINVSKGSEYSKYNGYTFEVVEVLSKVIALNINGVVVDFSFKEVFIVDFDLELSEAKVNCIRVGSTKDFILRSNLLSYKKSKGIVSPTMIKVFA